MKFCVSQYVTTLFQMSKLEMNRLPTLKESLKSTNEAIGKLRHQIEEVYVHTLCMEHMNYIIQI